jgi:opacity protein-like surface antigen
MTKQLLGGVAAVGLMSSAAFAQTYIPTSPPPAAVAPPAVGVPGSTTTTTTTSPTTGHTTTITKGVDANGNEITKEDSYREGVAGSSETHTKTFTDPDGGTTTTRSKTTTKQE